MHMTFLLLHDTESPTQNQTGRKLNFMKIITNIVIIVSFGDVSQQFRFHIPYSSYGSEEDDSGDEIDFILACLICLPAALTSPLK